MCCAMLAVWRRPLVLVAGGGRACFPHAHSARSSPPGGAAALTLALSWASAAALTCVRVVREGACAGDAGPEGA